MIKGLFGHSFNYALVLLLLALLVYSSIGLCVTVYPVSADAVPLAEEGPVVNVGCRVVRVTDPFWPQIVP
jgi:hypothetical protein